MKNRGQRSRGIFWKLPVGIVLLTMIASAQTDEWQVPARAARKKSPITADAESIAVGRDLYVKECAACHGDKGRGDGVAAKNLDPPPRDFTATSVAKQTDGALFWKIGEGHTPMPGFGMLISEDGRWHVVCYLRTLALPPTTGPATQP